MLNPDHEWRPCSERSADGPLGRLSRRAVGMIAPTSSAAMPGGRCKRTVDVK